MPTSKQRHAIALAEHYTRATSPGAARLDQLEAVAAILGDDTPASWLENLDAARDIAARRATPDPTGVSLEDLESVSRVIKGEKP